MHSYRIISLLIRYMYVNEQQAKAFQNECFYTFRDKQLHLIDKPTKNQHRQCTDYCCLVVFVVLFVGFVTYSIFSIRMMFSKELYTLNPNDSATFLSGVSQTNFENFGKIVGACIGGSVALSLLILLLLKLTPQKMVFALSITPFLAIIAICAYDFIFIISGAAIYFAGVGFFYLAYIIYYRGTLIKAAILMKTVGNFIVDNLKILIILFFAILYCTLVLFLWVGGFYSFCVLYSHDELSYEGFIISFIVWVFMLIFFNFYFYYTSVFLTSNSLAIWFYGKDQQDTVVTPFKTMVRYHLGTITFASLIITFSKLLKFFLFFARFRGADNAFGIIGAIMSFLIYCCLGALEAMIEIINNWAIILCSLTGFGLIESGKILGQFIFEDPQEVFQDFTIATYFVNVGGALTISIIPSLVGGIMLLDLNGPLWGLGVVMIMFTSSMIGLICLQIFVESASTLFLLYILDGKLCKQGLYVVWIDKVAQQLDKGFDQAFVGKLQRQKIKTKQTTTVVVHQNGRVDVFQEQFEVEDDSNDKNRQMKRKQINFKGQQTNKDRNQISINYLN